MTDRVTVAYCHPPQVAASFHRSLLNLIAYDARNSGHVVAHLPIAASWSNVPKARNQMVSTFLDHTPADWLFMIDADMGFAPDTIDRLIEAADPEERPVVGGLCFVQRRRGLDPDTLAIRHAIKPTIYEWVDRGDDAGFVPADDYPHNRLVECAATGAACLLIHRTAAEEIRDSYGDEWFTPVQHPTTGTTFSEDLSFCVRVAGVDRPVFVHTGIKTSHLKDTYLDDVEFAAQTWTLPEFVITGTGRCGTGYTAQLLSDLGVPCGHEQVWTAHGVQPQPQLKGDASWMAATELDGYDGTVIHQVRNPLDVIRSMAGIRFFSDPESHGPYHKYAAARFDITGDDIADAARWWIDWNRTCEQHANLTVRVEDLPVERLLKTVGAPVPDDIEQVVRQIPETVNHRHRSHVKVSDIPEAIRNELEQAAGRYGYDLARRS